MDSLAAFGGSTGNSNSLGDRAVGEGDSAVVRTHLFVAVVRDGNGLRAVFHLAAKRSRSNSEEIRIVAGHA